MQSYCKDFKLEIDYNKEKMDNITISDKVSLSLQPTNLRTYMLRIKNGFSGERSIVLPNMIRHICENDEFLRQLYITDIGYYPHAMYHYRERPEGVAQYILIYCMKGSGWYEVAGNRHVIRSNQFVIIPRGMPHVYASNNQDPWTIYWIHFTGQMAHCFGEGQLEPKEIAPGTNSRINLRNDIFEDIFLTLSDNYSLENLRYASSLLYAFLASLCYLKQFRHYNPQQERIDTTDIVTMAVRYMKENIEKQLTLQQLCDYIGYSVSQFSLIFRKSIGQSPLNYFNRLKVNRACQLLETTDLKINQICTMVGIDDCYYFSRVFTKIVGVSPKKYRQTIAEKNSDSTSE